MELTARAILGIADEADAATAYAIQLDVEVLFWGDRWSGRKRDSPRFEKGPAGTRAGARPEERGCTLARGLRDRVSPEATSAMQARLRLRWKACAVFSRCSRTGLPCQNSGTCLMRRLPRGLNSRPAPCREKPRPRAAFEPRTMRIGSAISKRMMVRSVASACRGRSLWQLAFGLYRSTKCRVHAHPPNWPPEIVLSS